MRWTGLAAVAFSMLMVAVGCTKRAAPSAAEAEIPIDKTGSKAPDLNWSAMTTSMEASRSSDCGPGGGPAFITESSAGDAKQNGGKSLPDLVAERPPLQPTASGQPENGGCPDKETKQHSPRSAGQGKQATGAN